jgi:hypothetical protein
MPVACASEVFCISTRHRLAMPCCSRGSCDTWAPGGRHAIWQRYQPDCIPCRISKSFCDAGKNSPQKVKIRDPRTDMTRQQITSSTISIAERDRGTEEANRHGFTVPTNIKVYSAIHNIRGTATRTRKRMYEWALKAIFSKGIDLSLAIHKRLPGLQMT